jgi:hypothetical protein
MKIYLAGPMRGIANFNFPEFYANATMLREYGHEVFNPAENDMAVYGVDIGENNQSGSLEQAEFEHNFDFRNAMADDMDWICREAEAIFLLKGWEASKGASAEKALAEALGLHIWYEKIPLD